MSFARVKPPDPRRRGPPSLWHQDTLRGSTTLATMLLVSTSRGGNRRAIQYGGEALSMSWQEYNWGLVCDDPAICLAVHDLPEPVFLKRASDLRIEWVNRCGQERAMYPPGHFIGKTYYDVLPKEIADLLATTDHELLSGGRARDVRELPVVRGDGSRRNLRLSRSVLRNVDGMPTHVLGVAVDLTDRKKAEEHVKLLLNEANHRAKNLLAVVQVLARHTANEADPNDFVERFAQRLAGLASSHDLLVKSNWRS